MTSTARLSACGGRVLRMAATAPQRWSRPQPHPDGSLDVFHSLVGDGLFDGESHRTQVSVRGRMRLHLLGIAATPIRSVRPAVTAVRLSVEEGASLFYLPGALVPHAHTSSSHSLVADVSAGGSLLAGSIVTAGRTAMGESGGFSQLRLRTTIRSSGALLIADDATLVPAEAPLSGPGQFAGAEAFVTLAAVGECSAMAAASWPVLPSSPAVVAGTSALRGDGVVLRALADSLGSAQSFVAAAAAAAGFVEFR